jgi:thymidylate synthase (FAD)
VNECSARYSVVRDDFYEPLPEAVAVQSESNNQGRGKTLPEDQALAVVASLMRQAKESYSLYEELLEPSTGNGVARELARVALPLSTYTEFYWKIDLHNFLHFLRLRADAHAQYEIRAYADVLMTILRMWVPLTHEAFIDYRMDAKQFSRMELEALKRLLRGDTVVPRDLGLTPREWREFQDVLDLAGKSVSGGHPVGLYAAE